MEGILFFQDRSIAGPSNVISGGSSLDLHGALYFPTSHLDFSGSSSGTASCALVVASTITFSGSSTLGAGCSDFANGTPIKTVALAE
jgi:hypothetical protein